MRNPLNIITKGIGDMKDKAIEKIGTALRNRETRAIMGFICLGLSVGLLTSSYVKLPQ